MLLWCVRDGWRDIYSKRGLLPISSSRSQGVPTLAPSCKLVRDASARLRVPCSTAILCTLSKTDRVVLITWFPSGYTPVRPECPDVPSSSCLLIKMWQLTKAHGVTRNELKIHVICYVTLCMDTECRQEELSRAMADREGWWESDQENPCGQYIFTEICLFSSNVIILQSTWLGFGFFA